MRRGLPGPRLHALVLPALGLLVGGCILGGCIIRFFPPPTLCDETPIIAASGTFVGTTIGAASEVSPDPTLCNGAAPANEVIYTLELEEASSVHLDTVGSDFDTLIYIREECENQLSEVGCNDDAVNLQSSLDIVLDAGSYFLFVDGFNGDRGDYVLNAVFGPPDRPAGDQCANMVTVLGGEEAGDTTGFVDDTSASCGGVGAPDAYFVVTLLNDSDLTLEIESADFDTVLSVRLSCLEGESELACDDDGGAGGGLSRLELPALQPGTYIIVVDGQAPGESGVFSLRVIIT